MQPGSKIDEPRALLRSLRDLAAPSARNASDSIVGTCPRQNQQAPGAHSGSANALPTMQPDTQAGSKQFVQALHEPERVLPRKRNAAIWDCKREKIDRVIPTGVRFLFQIKLDDLIRRQQRDDGVQTEFLP
jgi:hypothetical protein